MLRLLVECLVDAGKQNDAADFSKVTSDFIEQHTPELYPRIFSIQVNNLLSPLVNCTVYYILLTQLRTPDCLGLGNMLPNEPCIFPFLSPYFSVCQFLRCVSNFIIAVMCWHCVWHDSQVQYDLIDVSNILTKASPKLLAIYKLQKLKKWVDRLHCIHWNFHSPHTPPFISNW